MNSEPDRTGIGAHHVPAHYNVIAGIEVYTEWDQGAFTGVEVPEAGVVARKLSPAAGDGGIARVGNGRAYREVLKSNAGGADLSIHRGDYNAELSLTLLVDLPRVIYIVSLVVQRGSDAGARILLSLNPDPDISGLVAVHRPGYDSALSIIEVVDAPLQRVAADDAGMRSQIGIRAHIPHILGIVIRAVPRYGPIHLFQRVVTAGAVVGDLGLDAEAGAGDDRLLEGARRVVLVDQARRLYDLDEHAPGRLRLRLVDHDGAACNARYIVRHINRDGGQASIIRAAHPPPEIGHVAADIIYIQRTIPGLGLLIPGTGSVNILPECDIAIKLDSGTHRSGRAYVARIDHHGVHVEAVTFIDSVGLREIAGDHVLGIGLYEHFQVAAVILLNRVAFGVRVGPRRGLSHHRWRQHGN